jgi:hypothetical protein
MAYPSRYNGRDCPSTHPVRLPGVFFAAFYAVDKFPHGQGTQPFVLSNGDPTGYGFHGDFVSFYCRNFEENSIFKKRIRSNGEASIR